MYDFCRQVAGEGLNAFADEEILLRKAEAIDGVGSVVGVPMDGSIALRRRLDEVLKPGERKKIQKQAKKEEARYKAHKDLYDYLINDTIFQFHASAYLIEPHVRTNWIRGILGIQFPDLNMSNWDEREIISAKKFFQKYEKVAKGKEDEGMSSAQNTIMNPLRVAASLDPSGYALQAVQMSQQVFDSIKNRTHKLKSRIDGHNNQIARVVDQERSQEAHELLRDIMDGRQRNLYPVDIPTDPVQFNIFRNGPIGRQFFYSLKHAHLQHNIDMDGEPGRYVMVDLSKVPFWGKPAPKGQKSEGELWQERLEAVIRGKYGELPEQGVSYAIFKVPSNIDAFIKGTSSAENISESLDAKGKISVIDKNPLEQGFYEATVFDTYGSVMPNTTTKHQPAGKKRRGYQNFERKEKQPPKKWMDTIWRVAAEQREMYQEIFDEFKAEIASYNDSVNSFRASADKVLELWGIGEEREEGKQDEQRTNFIDMIENMGDFNSNLVYDEDNDVLLSPNTYVRNIKEGYDFNQWHIGHYWDMLSNALADMEEKRATEQRDVDRNSRVLQSKEATEADIEEAMSAIDRATNRIEELDNMTDIISEMERRSSGEPSFEAQKDMVLNGKMLMFKSRGLLNDPMLRRRDPELMKDYIESGYRTIEMNKIKLALLKSMVFMPNKQLAEYVIDQVLASSGSPQVQAGLFKMGYSNEGIAKWLPKMMPWRWKGRKFEMDAGDVARMGAMHNGFIVYSNLGYKTAFTNNFQRITPWLDYGWPLMARGTKAIWTGDDRYTSEEWMDIVRETGVLDPIQAFTDMLLAGAKSSSGWDFVVPLVDMAKVKLGAKGFAQKWTIDSVLKKALGKEEADLQALKKRIHEVATSETKDKALLKRQIRELNLGLSESYMGRLVAWKLGWVPIGKGLGLFTMTESEQLMRAEVALMGMFQAEAMGELGDVQSILGKNPDAKPWLSEAGIRMARLMVYNTMFGMSQQFLPKMFRGAVGKWFWQFKSYQYHQAEHDMKYLSNFWRGNKGRNMFTQSAEAPVRIVAEVAKMIGRAPGRLGSMISPIKKASKWKDMDNTIDDRTANRLAKFLLIRGFASAVSVWMFYHSAFTGILRIGLRGVGRSPSARRGIFGAESPLFTYPIHIMRALYMAMAYGIRGDEEEDFEDFFRDWLPPAFSGIHYLLKGEYLKFARAYTPEPLKTGLQHADREGFLDGAIEQLRRF